MRHGHRFCRLTPGSRRLARAVLGYGVSVALLLSIGTGALAAGGTRVVPPKGKVAGQGYAYYLERDWQITFGTTPPVKACQTLTVNGQHVAFLELSSLNSGTYRYACNEPAGRPLYAIELSNECSTFKGDHGKFGTSDSQLMRCARALFKGGKQITTVDGRSVDATKLVAATGVYPVHVPKNNFFGSKKAASGRSAAYGWGLLLTGFSKGTHTIHGVASIGTSHWDITWTAHVH